jgi:hypothetical protein
VVLYAPRIFERGLDGSDGLDGSEKRRILVSCPLSCASCVSWFRLSNKLITKHTEDTKKENFYRDEGDERDERDGAPSLSSCKNNLIKFLALVFAHQRTGTVIPSRVARQ